MENPTRLITSPIIFLLIMHRLVKGDTEKIAKIVNAEIEEHYKTMMRDYHLGLAFGKYDLLMEYEPVSLNDSNNFIKNFREWIWKTKIKDLPIRGCFSIMTCYEIGQVEESSKSFSSEINTYSLFRLDPKDSNALYSLMKDVAQEEQDNVRLKVFWNPSAISYLLKVSGNDFAEIFRVLFDLREGRFLRDLCTFVTLDWAASDRSHKAQGLKAMINIKINEKGLANAFLNTFDDVKLRLGHFDFVREIDCRNLSTAFDAIKETRDFLLEKANRNLPNRTGTVFHFSKEFLRSPKGSCTSK